MKVPRTRRARGFGLFELVVNLGLMASMLGMIGAMVTWASSTVSGTSGKIAASEKTEAVRRLIAADLSAVPVGTDHHDLVRCDAGNSSWRLVLRLPSKRGGWTETEYRWTKDDGTLRRLTIESENRLARVICTGVSRLESHWLVEASSKPEDAPASWSAEEPPALLQLKVSATRFREEGRRDHLREAHAERGTFDFLMPVGGGPAAR